MTEALTWLVPSGVAIAAIAIGLGNAHLRRARGEGLLAEKVDNLVDSLEEHTLNMEKRLDRQETALMNHRLEDHRDLVTRPELAGLKELLDERLKFMGAQVSKMNSLNDQILAAFLQKSPAERKGPG